VDVAVLNATRLIVVGGRDNTSLRFGVRPATLARGSTTTLEAELSVENVQAAVGGGATEARPTRELMLLTLADVKLLLLPASFHRRAHVSRLSRYFSSHTTLHLLLYVYRAYCMFCIVLALPLWRIIRRLLLLEKLSQKRTDLSNFTTKNHLKIDVTVFVHLACKMRPM